MKLTRGLVSFSLIFSIAILSVAPLTVAAQDSKIALQRGYRTGYSDGYMAGYRDVIDAASKNARQHAEYDKADRAFSQSYGSLEDYQDGYRQGFEAGYETGFEKKSFDATLPMGLARRGPTPEPAYQVPAAQTPVVTEPEPQPAGAAPQRTDAAAATNPEPVAAAPATTETQPPTTEAPKPNGIQKVAYVASDDPVIIIPRDTELILELDEAMDTERNREGDKFTAKIVSPVELAGARVEGHVDKVTKPGRLKRRSELLLSFDRLIVSERRWTNFDAILTEVLPVKGDNVKAVDGEGTAIGKGSLKSDAIKVGAATGTGATVGVIAGGPVGAAVGAGVGAAFGVGAVVIEKGKHIKLNQAQQLRIKTSYETQIR